MIQQSVASTANLWRVPDKLVLLFPERPASLHFWYFRFCSGQCAGCLAIALLHVPGKRAAGARWFYLASFLRSSIRPCKHNILDTYPTKSFPFLSVRSGTGLPSQFIPGGSVGTTHCTHVWHNCTHSYLPIHYMSDNTGMFAAGTEIVCKYGELNSLPAF